MIDRTLLTGAMAVEATLTVSATLGGALQPQPPDPRTGPRVIPNDLADWLAALRLLAAVPFAYLVPDAELLPQESARFFYLDRAWTDALVQGAMSVGTVTTADHAQLEAVYPYVRSEVDEAERLARVAGHDPAPLGPAGTVTGLLLRSRAVAGWPGLHVRAYSELVPDDAMLPDSDPRRLRLLRMERLAPAVLAVLIDGVPRTVHVEEPRQGLQFGVRPPDGDPADATRQGLVPPRDVNTGEPLVPMDDKTSWVPVRFRPGAPGVLNLRKTRDALLAVPGTNMGSDVDSAEFAIQMLRYPYRQVFGPTGPQTDPETNPSAAGTKAGWTQVFRPRIEVPGLLAEFTEETS